LAFGTLLAHSIVKDHRSIAGSTSSRRAFATIITMHIGAIGTYSAIHSKLPHRTFHALAVEQDDRVIAVQTSSLVAR